ncbi:Wzz/FepE/Etk N-terminal domain-containing protein [Staphylococcus haemolyticus]|uniref:Wzz/FepE/Etk N-terminal domain-containing protein n=1 Tax=Staphylococcus haemolyticus TaxID=1283 RepID=UPI001F0A169C|nr:Wzz/FepE/Etk N-terminal domain-containing protein [Staphylococcus haemolyticus]MCH4475892.1 Wzz/FepE/Etk N-terminal domain-containing protein [Staphylococcus haemolyticus]
MEKKNGFTHMLELFRKNWKLMVLLPIVLMLISLLISMFLMKPAYQANTQVLVNQKNKDSQVMAQEVQGNIQLINTYSEILESPRIIDAVAKNEKFSANEIAEMISVESGANSQILNINVKGSDKKTTEKIANKTAKVFQNKMPDIMNVDNVSILSSADNTANQISPKTLVNCLIGFIIGILLSLIIIGLKQVFDKRIKTEEDVLNELNLPVLGSIQKLK